MLALLVDAYWRSPTVAVATEIRANERELAAAFIDDVEDPDS
jgi:hypothetical protein